MRKPALSSVCEVRCKSAVGELLLPFLFIASVKRMPLRVTHTLKCSCPNVLQILNVYVGRVCVCARMHECTRECAFAFETKRCTYERT